MKTYEEFMENMTCAFINQFLELVKSHVESIMFVLYKTNLRAGPAIAESCLLGNFEPLTLLALNFKLILIYPILRVRKTSFHHFLHVHLPL